MEEKGIILCIGDSNTYGYDPTDFYEGRYAEYACWTGILSEMTGCRVFNYGACGAQIPRSSYEITTMGGLIESFRGENGPIQVFVMLGTNDLLSNPHFTAEDVAARMETFLRALLETQGVRAGEIRIRLLAPPLVQHGTWVQEERVYRESRRLSAVYQLTAKKLGIAFSDMGKQDIPVTFDGVHLSEEGHQVFADLLVKQIKEETALFK